MDNQLNVSQMLWCWWESVIAQNEIIAQENKIRSYPMSIPPKKSELAWKDTLTIYMSKIWYFLEYTYEPYHSDLTDYLHCDIETIQVNAMHMHTFSQAGEN